MNAGTLTHLVPGPQRHGVVGFASALHDRLVAAGVPIRLRRTVPGTAGTVHAQFTDRIFGDTATAAGDAFEALPGAVTVTLHDLPTPRDGAGFAERRLAYSRVCRRAAAVVVNSDHERRLLAEHLPAECLREVVVIPLPVPEMAPGPPAPPRTGPSIGVFGFLYPGKGHAEILAAAAELPPQVEVVALGDTSAGHDDLVTDLRAAAARTGRRFTVTGHLPDAAVWGELRAVTIPVMAHRNVSASASMKSWLAAGRRPLAPDNRYAREIADRNPGAVWLYRDDPAGLAEALHAALLRPQDTWIPPGAPVHPSPTEAAAEYAAHLRRWHRC